MTKGWQTTEFWIALACIVGGVVCLILGKEDVGKWLIGIGAGGYVVSRGVAKIGSGKTEGGGLGVLVSALLLPILLVGCCNHHISVDAIDGTVTTICDTHDRLLRGEEVYEDLNKDGKLDESEKAPRRQFFLNNTALIRQTLAEAKKK